MNEKNGGAYVLVTYLIGAFVLLILKAVGIAKIAWVWAVAPFWIPMAFYFASIGIMLIASAILNIKEKRHGI